MDKDTNIASLIFWRSIEDKERIERWIKRLQEQGHIESASTHTYNPEYGQPVWYIP